MRRPQFSLKTMLWLMVVVAAFFGGIATERQLQRIRLAEEERQALEGIFVLTDPDEPWSQVWEKLEKRGKKTRVLLLPALNSPRSATLPAN